jgi:hypothetical protein
LVGVNDYFSFLSGTVYVKFETDSLKFRTDSLKFRTD